MHTCVAGITVPCSNRSSGRHSSVCGCTRPVMSVVPRADVLFPAATIGYHTVNLKCLGLSIWKRLRVGLSLLTVKGPSGSAVPFPQPPPHYGPTLSDWPQLV